MTPSNPSQIRLLLWDYITREIRLPAASKSILLALANLTDPRSRTAHAPISLLVVYAGLSQSDVSRLLGNLDANQWIETNRIPADPGRPPITVYNLSSQLIQLALRQS
ncbi:hypothetical protein [Leptolyngbya sp. FACHB-261]|uniref:hypothetical protein n=1 Tax=Leptolyngbya sp. FACHB-261 TaxID=2692806 RepID=UPI0016890329|nr:hypothetical protein [Leptolyngbya sp. FACHB-261]MBD2101706.1 hypothetical protein [Leptolyngbya sp. FACHB-261]